MVRVRVEVRVRVRVKPISNALFCKSYYTFANSSNVYVDGAASTAFLKFESASSFIFAVSANTVL